MEAKETETIADVLRAMRDWASNDMHAERPRVTRWADRIEAAAKREHLRDATKMVGNAATLRKALIEALEYCESDRESGIAYSDTDVLIGILRSGLSAPSRNCDRFATAEEAELAFGGVFPDDIGDHRAFIAWLFAPAEGGSHA